MFKLEVSDAKRADAISMPLTTRVAKMHSLDDTIQQEIDRLYDQLQAVLVEEQV